MGFVVVGTEMGVTVAAGMAVATGALFLDRKAADQRPPRTIAIPAIHKMMIKPALTQIQVDEERFGSALEAGFVEAAFVGARAGAIGACAAATTLAGSEFAGVFATAGFIACESRTNVPCMGMPASSHASLKA